MTHHTTHRRPWRVRRCPNCWSAFYAGDLAVIGTYQPGWNPNGTIQRICPECGHIGPTSDFPVVRDEARKRREAREDAPIVVRIETPIRVSVYEPVPPAVQLPLGIAAYRQERAARREGGVR